MIKVQNLASNFKDTNLHEFITQLIDERNISKVNEIYMGLIFEQ